MMCWIVPFFTALSLTVVTFHFSSGFSPDKIVGELLPDEGEFEIPTFSEPYTYLSHGRQCFVFESADKKTVLKLFNQNYFNSRFVHLLPQGWKELQLKKFDLRLKFFRESYPLAMKEFREETGLLSVHLHHSTLRLPTITLIDPSGRKIKIDLNRSAFVIQKKATSYLAHMEAVSQNEGFDGLKREIDAWASLCAKRIDLKISDYDHDIWQNSGLLDGKLIYIDPGKFYKNEVLSESGEISREWWKAKHRLFKWLLTQNRQAAEYLYQINDPKEVMN